MTMGTQQKHPAFISKALFDFLKINIIQRMTMKPRIEFLNLKRNEIEKRNICAKNIKRECFLKPFGTFSFLWMMKYYCVYSTIPTDVSGLIPIKLLR